MERLSCGTQRAREGDVKARPNAVAGFIALDKGASKTTHLDTKTRELIAIAIAVTTRCDGCIGVHTDRAIKAGATREEVAEALGVAIALYAGAALAYCARVLTPMPRSTARRSRQPNKEPPLTTLCLRDRHYRFANVSY